MNRGSMCIGLFLSVIGATAWQGCGSSGGMPESQADAGIGSDAATGGDTGAGSDAATPDGYTVRGTAIGVLQPLELRLDLADGSETLRVDADGFFAFETRLDLGQAYSIAFVDAPPCVLDNESGTVADADPEFALTCEGVVLLSGLSLSGITPDLGFSPTQLQYMLDIPLSQDITTVTAIALSTSVTITAAGAPVASGEPSAPVPLALGANEIDVVVSHPQGWQRSYHLNVRRAAALAQYAYGKASNSGEFDSFGISMAASGDTLVVGASQEDSAATGVNGDQDDETARESGAVYVFRRTGASWVQEAYLKASNSEAGDGFGTSVTLSGDVLAVGAPFEDSSTIGLDGDQGNNDALDSGAAYIFRRTGVMWAQEAYIKASNTETSDAFGTSVALSGDLLAVGVPSEASTSTGIDGDQSSNEAFRSGAVYVFRHNGARWEQEAYVKASNAGAFDTFGTSLAASGNVLAVGAPGEGSSATGVGGGQDNNGAFGSGAVYVFRHDGIAWSQEAYVKTSNSEAGDGFGTSVALSSNVLAIGAPSEDSAARGVDGLQEDNGASFSGAVYVFRHDGIAWSQEAYVKASNSEAGDGFGTSVALSSSVLAVGAPSEDSAARGVDGLQEDNGALDSGAVHVFRHDGNVWGPSAYLKASNASGGDQFGLSVALTSDAVGVGAFHEDSAATDVGGGQDNDGAQDSGAVYVFH